MESPLPLGPLATAWIERQAKNRTKSRRLQALIARGDAATYREYLIGTLPVLAKLARREPRVDVKPRVAGRVEHDDSHGCLQTPGRPGKAN